MDMKNSFPLFLKDTSQLKFGKEASRAHQHAMRFLNRLAGTTDHFYEKHARVRSFARAAGIRVCCAGRLQLLNSLLLEQYEVEGMDACGKDDMAPQRVVVQAPPTAFVRSSRTFGCVGTWRR